MKKKVYISLPIKGHDWDEIEHTNENAKWVILNLLGAEPVSPLENGLPRNALDCQHMQADYKMLLDCDAIYLCSGWEYSHGCMNELQVAADCRKIVLFDTMGRGVAQEKLNGKG